MVPLGDDAHGPPRQDAIWSIRIQFDRACTITKLVPNLGSEQPGEVYLRQRKRWKLVGIIKNEDKGPGFVTSVDD
ncbi:putative lipoprotein [Myxococcus hansupus]|uniref:Putative lipoprotein n=1 Tax=Pseudomyxococcus hansupus TaxID=1297742 RepID=A0A0H4WYU3_9BACT|nr:hypothetical protein [Myxococcus hansupus]AKQ66510.1 putative lipoprotein [Myxococcus hansupus]